MHNISHQEYLVSCCKIAREAGQLIMTYFGKGHETRQKADKSPVTDADIAANSLITNALLKLAPNIPIIAEEDDMPQSGGHPMFWLVDPLDGTRSFVRGEAEFTVNIALIEKNMPILGVIYAPPQNIMYYGSQQTGAFRQEGITLATPIRVRRTPHDGVTVVKSRSHPSAATKEFLSKWNVREILPSSSSIKFCSVAEGSADIYPRYGRTMEWDTAAGHAILMAAGGRVETPEGRALTYGKPGYENGPFIAYGDCD